MGGGLGGADLDSGRAVEEHTAFYIASTRAELLDLLRYHSATGQYGQFAYNNLGLNLAGMVLEAVPRIPA